MSSNLPPGVTENMIPGNRPEDEAWDDFHAKIDDDCTEMALTPDEAQEIWELGKQGDKLKKLCSQALNIAAGLTNHAEENASVRKLEKELAEVQREYWEAKCQQ